MSLFNRSFLVTVFSVNGKGERKSLGQAIVPLSSFDRKKEMSFQRGLEDLVSSLSPALLITFLLNLASHLPLQTTQYKSNRKSLAYASVLHELRDAYVAHTVAKAPEAIFSGTLLQQNKVWAFEEASLCFVIRTLLSLSAMRLSNASFPFQRLRLSCRKAGCSSKVVLFNGNLCAS